MTNSTELRDPNLTGRLSLPVLGMLLGFLTVSATVVHGYLSINALWGPRGRSAAFALASNLIIVGAIWFLSRRSLSRPRAIALMVLLAFVALLGLGAGGRILENLSARDFRGWSHWSTVSLLAGNLLLVLAAIWGTLALKPWQAFLKATDEPVSPATRRTNQLFGLAGLVGVLAVVALTLGTRGGVGNPVWSNSQNLSMVFAIAAIAIWLLAMALSWWWYLSADEHERRANDVGFLVGGGLFMAATPVWWILWRAGLTPAPDAMILWYATVIAMGIGWAWHRNR